MGDHTEISNQSLNVLRFIDSYDMTHGGPPAGVKALDARLRGDGHNIRTLSMETRRSVLPDLTEFDEVYPGVRFLGRTFSWRLWRRARTLARTSDIVVVHGFYLWIDIVAWLVARRNKIPLIIQPHGVFERYQQRQSVLPKKLFDLMIGTRIRRSTRAVLVASLAEIEGVSDLFPTEVVHVVGIGVDLASEPAKVTLGDGPIRLLTLSRVSPKKRIDVAIRATYILANAGIDVQLTITGTGESVLVNDLQRLASELAVTDRVTFVGHVEGEAKLAALREATVLLQPSENENFAVSVAEALYMGIPCVVTKDVATSEFVAQGAGVVVDSPDAEEVAGAIMQITHDEESYSRAREVAAHIARTQLSWGLAAARWETELERAISLGAREDDSPYGRRQVDSFPDVRTSD